MRVRRDTPLGRVSPLELGGLGMPIANPEAYAAKNLGRFANVIRRLFRGASTWPTALKGKPGLTARLPHAAKGRDVGVKVTGLVSKDPRLMRVLTESAKGGEKATRNLRPSAVVKMLRQMGGE